MKGKSGFEDRDEGLHGYTDGTGGCRLEWHAAECVEGTPEVNIPYPSVTFPSLVGCRNNTGKNLKNSTARSWGLVDGLLGCCTCDAAEEGSSEEVMSSSSNVLHACFVASA